MEGRIELSWPYLSRGERVAGVAMMLTGVAAGLAAAEVVERATKKKIDSLEYARAGAGVAFFVLELAKDQYSS